MCSCLDSTGLVSWFCAIYMLHQQVSPCQLLCPAPQDVSLPFHRDIPSRKIAQYKVGSYQNSARLTRKRTRVNLCLAYLRHPSQVSQVQHVPTTFGEQASSKSRQAISLKDVKDTHRRRHDEFHSSHKPRKLRYSDTNKRRTRKQAL